MQTVAQLNETFGISGLLTFDEAHAGMPRARIATPACSAELYLQGAHLTQWQPEGERPVLFLSSRSAYTPGKAIRGGIPVICPWFGAPETSAVHPPAGSPSHGVARTSPWTLRFAALAGDDLHLSLTLDPNDTLETLGFGALQFGLDLVLGAELTVRLTTAYTRRNEDAPPLHLEEALHSYLAVGDIDRVAIEGLSGTDFLDKTEDLRRKTQEGSVLTVTGEVDRPYLNTQSTVTLVDHALGRRVLVSKQNSRSTVIWNPAAAATARLADLAPDDWRHFVCIETANVGENSVRLLPGDAHSMQMQLAVEPL